MSYEKQNITQLDIVNLVEILNHIEDGMADIENSIPTKVSKLTNDSKYLTLSTLPKYDGSVS